MQSHKTNLKLTASESRLDLTSRSKKGRSIIVSDHDPDLQAELVHRVSESEKREIMKACPGFSEKNFIRDDKVESAPFKVVLGEGTYAKVVLGRLLASEETPQLNNNKDYKRFIAVRKVKSSSALLETTEQDRKNVLEMAEKELELHEKLKSSKALAADLPIVLFASHKKNKREEDQIYQALPLADFGNGIKLIKSIRKSSLTNDEKNTDFILNRLLERFVHYMQSVVLLSTLNRKICCSRVAENYS
ncbi:hypothetical protein [Aquicella lusitana]|uniref:Uncharacterized protein n=1 Tax=Aquicella lusitana TaxID=254246 RepID=A0A370GWR8_9COXI|nr:hypothetical protein [Aquicella lusitana]RDI48107.1 hypothetical protein C8D86_10372 [Aquicella lusitana]VVC72877.1 hypothetical protein AQULUS_06010 [Aquicella lusitana]